MLPIVLVHGIARFDILSEILRRLNPLGLGLLSSFQYFNGIASHLTANGVEHVFAPNLDFAGHSELRAAQLKTAIDFYLNQTGSNRAHIIAHSMGGLDARRMIADKGMGEKIASLTTIGTPHLGTVLADHLISIGGDGLIRELQKVIRLDLRGCEDLTIDACRTFNDRIEDSEARNNVFYQTYSASESEDRIFGPLLLSYQYILENAGENDGLVAVDSQIWKENLRSNNGDRKDILRKEFSFPADHLNEVGWWDLEERDGFFSITNPLAQKRIYEDKVKAVYLEIADSVRHL